MKFDVNIAESRLDGRRVEFFDEIGSTNTELVSRIKESWEASRVVIAASSQSAGRGRHGKSFSSPEGGIYFSFAAKNKVGGLATVAAGAAVARTLESYGCRPSIKWVNDVLIGGKKVCGILAEAVSGTSLCVIGIGIDLRRAALPPELCDIATALDEHIARLPSPEEIVSDVISEYERLERLDNAEVIKLYKTYLDFLGDKILIKGSEETAVALDVDTDGALLVRVSDGSVIRLDSGEISIKTDGYNVPKE